MRHTRSGFRIMCCVIAALGFAVSAGAEEESRSGQAPVDSVDPAGRTITIDEVAYKVPRDYRILRQSGVAVELGELRGGDRPVEVIPLSEVVFVRFEAALTPSGWQIVDLIVVYGPID